MWVKMLEAEECSSWAIKIITCWVLSLQFLPLQSQPTGLSLSQAWNPPPVSQYWCSGFNSIGNPEVQSLDWLSSFRNWQHSRSGFPQSIKFWLSLITLRIDHLESQNSLLKRLCGNHSIICPRLQSFQTDIPRAETQFSISLSSSYTWEPGEIPV